MSPRPTRIGAPPHRALLVAFLTLAAAAWPAVAFAAKQDVVVLQNGDHVTGEVKWLTRGKLNYSTDDAGRLEIEWVKIARVTSPHSFEVELDSGEKYFGRLSAIDRDGAIVVAGVGLDTLSIPSVVQISTLDAGFLKRMRAYLDLGLTFAKANQATTFSSEGQADYRGDKFGATLLFNSYSQGQESVPTTSRNSAGVRVIRFLPKRWSVLVLSQAEQNDELGLEFRLTGAAALGRVLQQSNSSEIGVGGGLAVTRERFSPASSDPAAEEEEATNLEGLLSAVWDAFRFDSPKLDFSTSLYLYPSISSPGRVRGEAATRIKYELLSDFNVGVSATDTFDSDPPEETATTNDFIITFTIGWSYRR